MFTFKVNTERGFTFAWRQNNAFMGLKMSRLKPSQGAGEDGSKWTKQLCKVTNMWTYIRNEWRMTDCCPARSISNTTLVLWEREMQDLRMSKWQEIRSCRPLFMLHSHNTHTGTLQIMQIVLQVEGQGQGKMDYSTHSIMKTVIQKKIHWSGTRQGFLPSSLLFNTALDVQPEN